MSLSISPNPQGAFRVLAFLVLASLVIFLGARTWREIREGRAVTPQNVISISGRGSLFAKPDIGHVSVSIVREKKTVAEAQRDAANAANKVFAFLKSKGVEEKDIKTTNFSIYPKYNYTQDRGQVLLGYEVRQTFDVKIRKLEMAGDIIAGASSAGANEVGNLSFTIDDSDALKAEAREKAIKNAKEKAEKLSNDLGVRLGRLVNFSESDGGYQPQVFYKAEAVGIGGGVSPSPALPSGENEIVSNVTLVYEIR